MIKKAEEFKEEDDNLKDKIEKKNGLENFLYNLKNNVNSNNSENSEEITEIKNELDPIIEEGLKWLQDNDNLCGEDYENKQKEIQEKTNPIMMKLYKNQGDDSSQMPNMNTNVPPDDDLD